MHTVAMPKTNAGRLDFAREDAHGAAFHEIPTVGERWPSLARAYLITEMRRDGVMRLEITKDWDLEEGTEAATPDPSA